MKKLLLIFSVLFSFFTSSASEVWFCNTEDWEEVYVYAWSNENETITDSWPGNLMSDVEGGLWYYDTSQTPSGLIFNNGKGAQTSDLHYFPSYVYTGFGSMFCYSNRIASSLSF